MVASTHAAGTLGYMMDKIADEIARDDLSGDGGQIADKIVEAITSYQPERFFFSESRDITFSTNAGQEFYSAADNPAIPNLQGFDYVILYIGSIPRPIARRTDVEIEVLNQNGLMRGQPWNWSYYNQQLRLGPVPDTIYPMRIAAHRMTYAPTPGRVTTGTYAGGGNNSYTVGDVLTAIGGAANVAAQFAVNGPASSGAYVAASGSNLYAVGDILTCAGGTFSPAAQLTVTSNDNSGGEGRGVITGLALTTPGRYSARPTNPCITSAVSGTVASAGQGALINLTFALQSAASLSLATGGQYSVQPTNPVATSGGTGVGATLTLAFDDDLLGNPWMSGIAEKLIRARAKYELYLHVIRNMEMAEAMAAAVTEAVDQLKGQTNRLAGRGVMAPMEF